MLLKTALQTVEEPFPEHLDAKILVGIQSQNKATMFDYLNPRFLPLYAVTICVIVFYLRLFQ